MPEDFRAMNIALEQLVKEKAIQRYEHTKIAKSKGKGAKDYTYKLWPTNEFVSTIIKGHQAEARREIQLMAKRCLLYTSPSPRDRTRSRMPSSA